AQYRAAEMLQMDPDLVGAAGLGVAFDPGEIAGRSQHFVIGDGGLTVGAFAFGIGEHAPAGLLIEFAQVDVDAALGRRRSAFACRPKMRQPLVSRSRRWARAGSFGRPKRRASRYCSTFGPPPGPAWTGRPAGLSMMRMRPSR